MLQVKNLAVPSGLDADQDAALLLRRLGASVAAATVTLLLLLAWNGQGLRPALAMAFLTSCSMLALVHTGRLRAAAHVLCWGLLCSGGVGVWMFGLRSSGITVIPLAIMAGGWLVGRNAAIALASTASALTLAVFARYGMGHPYEQPPVQHYDAFVLVAIFLVTSMLSAAMVATLRGQFDKVNAMAAGLQEANATLEARVSERSTQLAAIQQQVMEAEKLASLGAMVAGISHELNTPLGNALTVSSTLEEQVKTLSQRVEAGTLTRTDMAQFVSGAAEMSRLATQSITRAAELVASFKQVAADQTSEQRRTFALDRVVADNVAALRPSIGKAGLVIELRVPAGISCDNYPGPLGQVITNLVQNAVVHGFDGQAKGRIDVSAMTQGDTVHLMVSDNGRGMQPQVLARVFEPFFTTRLGHGGSGLGLSVSHRIAHSVLGGELTARSEPGQGSTFTLSFPARLPGTL